MDETKKWLIALVVSVLMAFGANYWSNTISQARIDERLSSVEGKVIGMELVDIQQTRQITENIIAIKEVHQGWKTVAKAVEANTDQLKRFTEVLIRLDERGSLNVIRSEMEKAPK